jgi:hypothetical protein
MRICEITHCDYSSVGEERRQSEVALGRITHMQVTNHKQDSIR